MDSKNQSLLIPASWTLAVTIFLTLDRYPLYHLKSPYLMDPLLQLFTRWALMPSHVLRLMGLLLCSTLLRSGSPCHHMSSNPWADTSAPPPCRVGSCVTSSLSRVGFPGATCLVTRGELPHYHVPCGSVPLSPLPAGRALVPPHVPGPRAGFHATTCP
jgi:hypothetical protein